MSGSTDEASEESNHTEITKQTDAGVSSSVINYYASSRIERDNMYSEMIETYKTLLANESVSGDQKAVTTNEITAINNKKNSIMIAENLIKNLGFDDVVIFVNEGSVSVIVRADTLQDADVAQIQNIVCRELGVSAEVVHISVR